MTSPSVPVGDARPWLPRIRRPSGFTLGLVVIATFAVTAVAAPLFAPYSPNETDLTNTLAGMSSAHWLGTDALGRDVLSRLIYGARLSLLGPLIVVTGSTVIAVPLALAATYYGGVADGVLSRVSDALFGFPALLLAIATVAVFGPGFWTPTLVVTITYVPLLARVTRSAVLVEKAKPYTAACRLQGFGNRRIVFAHILPNIIGVVGAQAVLNFGYALLDLAGLAFLGFGVQPPATDWGQMLADGRDSLIEHAYLEAVAASLAITAVVLAFNTVGYAIAVRTGRQR